jgi:hypothetical protein
MILLIAADRAASAGARAEMSARLPPPAVFRVAALRHGPLSLLTVLAAYEEPREGWST